MLLLKEKNLIQYKKNQRKIQSQKTCHKNYTKAHVNWNIFK